MYNRFLSLAVVQLSVMGLTALAVDVSGLGSKDEKVRLETQAGLIGQKSAAVTTLLVTMDGQDQTAAKMADQTLFRIVQKYAGTPDQHDIAAALAGELSAQHKTETRRQICRLLSTLPMRTASWWLSPPRWMIPVCRKWPAGLWSRSPGTKRPGHSPIGWPRLMTR